MNAAALTLRLASPADARAIAQMSRDLIETGLAWRYRPTRVARMIDDPDTVVLVASQQGRLTGFGALQVGEERAHLILLAVRVTRQRQGVGRRLLDWLTATATTAGVSAIDLELRADNFGALDFYRAMGYQEGAELPGYYENGIAARRMVRVLRLDTRLPPWQASWAR